jgi:hypothetical protein
MERWRIHLPLFDFFEFVVKISSFEFVPFVPSLDIAVVRFVISFSVVT